jgi:hypothetical protein
MGRRFIFYGGARERNNNGSLRQEGTGANRTFECAARQVAASYPGFRDNGRMIRLSTAADMVNVINEQAEGSILSMDVLSHGSPWTLNFSREDNVNCGFYGNESIRTFTNDVVALQSGGDVNPFGTGAASITDISFANFVNDARIEFRGCNAANTDDPHFRRIRHLGRHLILAKAISEHLNAASRTRSYVIGHATGSTPNIPGRTGCDYRHGRRVIYHNGRVLYETRDRGHIPHEAVQRRMSGGTP